MALEAWLLTVISCFTAVVFLCFLLLILIYLTTNPYPDLERAESEKYFVDPVEGNVLKPFPTLKEPPSIDLSIIVPAYNEEDRLPEMLNESLKYLEERQKKNTNFKYEVIVADDGSKDKTTQLCWSYSKLYGTDKVRALTLHKNRGKGGAVRLGVLSSRGRKIMFADADGATKFSDVEILEQDLTMALKRRTDNFAVACGSRAHLQKDAIAKRSVFRTLLMIGFHMVMYFLCLTKIKDSQCGFKMFTRSAARLLFHNMHVERWAFDVDLLYLANHFRIPVSEVPVHWQEIDGSKLVPIFSWLQIGKDLLLIRLRYMLGAWKIEPLHKID